MKDLLQFVAQQLVNNLNAVAALTNRKVVLEIIED
jgi:hypothetical protein